MSKGKSPQKPIRNSPPAPKPTGNFSATSMSYYASKFPHPDHMERYEKLFPGAAEAIFTEFRKQAKHRQELEKLVIPQQLKNARAGIYVQAFGHACGACSTILTAVFTPWWVPISLAAIYSITAVIIYINGKSKQAKSLEQKQ